MPLLLQLVDRWVDNHFYYRAALFIYLYLKFSPYLEITVITHDFKSNLTCPGQVKMYMHLKFLELG